MHCFIVFIVKHTYVARYCNCSILLFSEGKVLGEDLIKNETSSLTRTQAAAVKKRIDTLNATIRKRQKQQQKTDVRDLFPPTQAVGDQVSEEFLFFSFIQQLIQASLLTVNHRP